MQTYLILIALIFILLILIQIFVTSVYNLVRNDGVPTINTFGTQKELMKEKLNIKKWSKLIDLWCGTGSALRFFESHYACKELVWIENNKVWLRIGKILNTLSWKKDIQLTYGDLYQTDISWYDYVYLFLMPKVMKKTQEWLDQNISKKTIVIVNTFKLPDWKPYKVIKDKKWTPVIYLYKKPK